MSQRRYQIWLVLCLATIIPLGLASKLYDGPGAWWVNGYAGGVLYETFWMVLIVLLYPRASIVWTAVGVFAVTSLIEVLQLWQPLWLTQVRATFLGRMLLGSSFSGWDFPHYLVGCALTGLWLYALKQVDKI